MRSRMAKHSKKVQKKLDRRIKDYEASIQKKADPRAFHKPGSRNLKKG